MYGVGCLLSSENDMVMAKKANEALHSNLRGLEIEYHQQTSVMNEGRKIEHCFGMCYS